MRPDAKENNYARRDIENNLFTSRVKKVETILHFVLSSDKLR